MIAWLREGCEREDGRVLLVAGIKQLDWLVMSWGGRGRCAEGVRESAATGAISSMHWEVVKFRARCSRRRDEDDKAEETTAA